MNQSASSFQPPWGLRNRHLQSMIASLKFRRPWVKKRAAAMLRHSREVLVPCGQGVRLQGHYSGQVEAGRGLAVLLHGWEGSSDSIYLLSAAGALFQAGLNVFRLNLRDHGTSHHLNREPFHSCLLEEVLDAVRYIQDEYSSGEDLFLAGFSLGGNFALRVAAHAPGAGIRPAQVAAVCPVLHPPATMQTLETGCFIYRKYFIRKWKRSLLKKQALFPDLYSFDDPDMFQSLMRMTAYLVERYTPFPDAQAYLNGYSITGDVLRDLPVPTCILASRDDPVIPIRDMDRVARSDNLDIRITDYGGHCGFLKGWSMRSWVDDQLVDLFVRR